METTYKFFVFQREISRDAVKWLETNGPGTDDPTCWAEIKDYHEEPALFCRGEYFAMIGKLARTDPMPENVPKGEVSIVSIEKTQDGLPRYVEVAIGREAQHGG